MGRDFAKEIDEYDNSSVFDDATVPVQYLWHIVQRNLKYGFIQTALYQLRTGIVDPKKKTDLESGVYNNYVSDELQFVVVDYK